MLGVRCWQVDAFTDRPFGGNPAAVCWLGGEDAPAGWMQSVAAEMNLPATAFVRRLEGGYGLRWFTAVVELELCGHGTLSSSGRDSEFAGDLTCRPATADDVPLLVRMNKELVEDEGSRNPMSLAELEERMRGWLEDDWRAAVFEQSGGPVGYILFHSRSDEYRPSDAVVYVRQFFIGRAHRSRGIGRRAFEAMASTCFPAASPVVLDVLETNPGARRFWESLGFRPYCTTMKLTLTD